MVAFQQMANSTISVAGHVKVLCTSALVTLTIIFSITLFQSNTSLATATIVASTLSFSTIIAVVLISYRTTTTSPSRRSNHLRKTRLAFVAGWFALASLFSIATLAWIQTQLTSLPAALLGTSTSSLLLTAFIIWAAVFVVDCLYVALLRRSFEHTHGKEQIDEASQTSSELQETPRPQTSSSSREKAWSASPTPTTPIQALHGSDAYNALRHSLTQVVRPISSKTRLMSQNASFRATSIDSGTGECDVASEDGFDSWDTSAVDIHSIRGVMHASSPTSMTGRVLETIPASPATSRSPSPGNALDLQPPPPRLVLRSRSYSPSPSFKTVAESEPSSPVTDEAHIHPLFRTDSPEPPRTMSPGTMVLAAPGGGQLMTDPRSLGRMRSGSLPSSPLMHSSSLDDIRRIRNMPEGVDQRLPERTLTPPIPDWVLGEAPKISFSGYSRRKPPNLGVVGE